MKYLKKYENNHINDIMKDFIKHSYSIKDAKDFFKNNITKESILELLELDYVYDLLESLGVVDKYSKNRNEILKDFEIVDGMGDDKYLVVDNKEEKINLDRIVREITNLYTK